MLVIDTPLIPESCLPDMCAVTPLLPEENTLLLAKKPDADQEEYDYLFRQMYLFLKLID